jgi:hypothetical protein
MRCCDALLEDDGVHFSLAMTGAVLTVIEGAPGVRRAAFLDALHGPVLSRGEGLAAGGMSVLEFTTANAGATLDRDAVIAAVAEAAVREPDFAWSLNYMLLRAEPAVRPGDGSSEAGPYFSPEAYERYLVLRDARTCLDRPDASPCLPDR